MTHFLAATIEGNVRRVPSILECITYCPRSFRIFPISNQHLVYKETKVITVVKGDPRKRCSELGSGWSGYGSAFGVEVGYCPTLSGLHCTKRSCSLVQLGVNRKQVPLFRDSSFSNDRPIDKQLEVGAVVGRGPGKGRPGRRSAGNILQGVVKIEVFNSPVLRVPHRMKTNASFRQGRKLPRINRDFPKLDLLQRASDQQTA